MREGFYNVDYAGVAGMGNAVIVLRRGQIIGAGVGGGKYDGRYRQVGKPGHFVVNVTVSIPAGSPTVMGAVAPDGGMVFDVQTTLEDGTDVQTAQVNTPHGAVRATVEFIRAL